MSSFDKIFIVIMIIMLLSLIGVNVMSIQQRTTRFEVITICDSIVKADSNTIFDKKNAGRLESCLYKLIEIERGEAYAWELDPHLHWLAMRNEQRIEAKNEKFND